MLVSEQCNRLDTNPSRHHAAVQIYEGHPSPSPLPSPFSDGDRKWGSGKWSCTKPTTASHYPLNSSRLITMTMTDGLLLEYWDGTQETDRNIQVQNTGLQAATRMHCASAQRLRMDNFLPCRKIYFFCHHRQDQIYNLEHMKFHRGTFSFTFSSCLSMLFKMH